MDQLGHIPKAKATGRNVSFNLNCSVFDDGTPVK